MRSNACMLDMPRCLRLTTLSPPPASVSSFHDELCFLKAPRRESRVGRFLPAHTPKGFFICCIGTGKHEGLPHPSIVYRAGFSPFLYATREYIHPLLLLQPNSYVFFYLSQLSPLPPPNFQSQLTNHVSSCPVCLGFVFALR